MWGQWERAARGKCATHFISFVSRLHCSTETALVGALNLSAQPCAVLQSLPISSSTTAARPLRTAWTGLKVRSSLLAVLPGLQFQMITLLLGRKLMARDASAAYSGLRLRVAAQARR